MTRLILTIAITAILMASLGLCAFPAPLFGDVPDEHWGRDAVANLAAKGLVEGYSDGTFKGDRAASRYELAMVVARLLAKNEQEHTTFATKAEMEVLGALVSNLKDELDALGVRVTNLEELSRRLDARVSEKERITFEGDFSAKCVSINIRNMGRTDTDWWFDVGQPGALNFDRLHKYGAVDLANGRPFINGVGYTSRMRLGIKAKVSEEISAGLRLAGYSSLGNPYINAYWGITAPYLSNHFAGNSPGTANIEGMNNTPWTRLTLDTLIAEHSGSKTRVILGSISETQMDNFILQKVPNPNVSGKSMAKFSERIVTERKHEEVVTLKYHESEETYLPFYGFQVRSNARLFSDVVWEAMYSKLPFGSNPTAGTGQPNANDVTLPQFVSLNGKWSLKDRGALKLDLLKVTEDNLNSPLVPNHGNYWFWSDPVSLIGTDAVKMPMRGNSFISLQEQTSYGISLNYVFEPSYIRMVLAYGGTDYRPNKESGYSAKGNHFRAGLGWTNAANSFRFDAEYISTDPYYDAFQLYFQPLGSLLLGGVPPGTPIAFSVVPAYFGGFPGSYAPFGYQLHDSGLYPNNREGFRASAEYRFPKGRGRIGIRGASFNQHTPTIPQQNITGLIGGMTPGFIDPVFHPLRTNGLTVAETPRGSETQLGGTLSYLFLPSRLLANIQYDTFKFQRSTRFAPATTTARRNLVNMRYDVLKVGLEYPTNKKLTLRGGFDLTSVQGYHPTTQALVGGNAGVTILDISQASPYIGFDYNISENVQWKFDGRLINHIDRVATDNISPESFAGTQFMSEFNVKF